MKIRTKPLLLVVATTIVVILSFNAAIPGPPAPPPPPPSNPATYDQFPPFIEKMWVQKLATPLTTGENMLMKIKYMDEFSPPSTLDVFDGQGNTLTFHDDGTNGDVTASDNIYSAYILDDPNEFRDRVETIEADLAADGSLIHFDGHVGTVVSTLPVFDEVAFNNSQEVEVDLHFLEKPGRCDNGVLNRNSLFITDKSVVEDPARTYNPHSGTGNVYGVWTFGIMMQNMVIGTTGGPTLKAFMKDWVSKWMQNVTVNGQIIGAREEVLDHLIIPWIIKARSSSGCEQGLVNAIKNDWEAEWDKADETDLMVNAPFKLTAIVNRIDLRENLAYTSSTDNAGETRFIFTLVNPCSNYIPEHLDMDFINPNPTFFDWTGMNVIFEYGNVQKTKCDIKNFGQQWRDLADMPMPSTAFNDALEQITNTVTTANAAPAKPNGSALNQIRTNEKIFQPTASRNNSGWRLVDWEFRQFEINASTGLLEQKPLTNTPINKTNFAQNLVINGKTYPNYIESDIHGVASGSFDTDKDNLVNWAYLSPIQRLRVQRGNYNMPETYPGSTPFLAGSGRVEGEYAHFWDLKWDPNERFKYDISTTAGGNKERNTRLQISLNTCQGCHMGETKTIFSQVQPIKYGVDARYWVTPPDNILVRLDSRSNFGQNIGTTNSSGVQNYPLSVTSMSYRSIVSAFLTGRTYGGNNPSNANYDDDVSNDFNDDKMTNTDLYIVNDPSNGTHYPVGNGYTVGVDRMNGFNDLARRRQHLCDLIQTSCRFSALDLAVQMHFYPFAVGAH